VGTYIIVGPTSKLVEQLDASEPLPKGGMSRNSPYETTIGITVRVRSEKNCYRQKKTGVMSPQPPKLSGFDKNLPQLLNVTISQTPYRTRNL
jgi:hypothetical protein